MDSTQNQREIRGCKLLLNDSDDVSKAQENQPNHFDTLPDEIHLDILKKVPQSELDSVALVCHRFNRIIEDRSLWKKVFRESCKLERGDVGKWMRRQVQDLYLRNVTIPQALFRSVLEATQASWYLKYLCLYKVDICPDDLVQMFTKCKQLTRVDLLHTFVNNDVFVAITGKKNIEILCLREGGEVQPVTTMIYLQSARRLQEFYIETCYHTITLNSICENLAPSLLELTLCCRRESLLDHHIAHIVRKCPLLRRLHLSFGRTLTATSAASVGNLKHLRTLNMDMCTQIPPEAFFAMAYEMESLEFLHICNPFRDDQERRYIEELFGLNTIKVYEYGRVGTFYKRSGVVKMVY